MALVTCPTCAGDDIDRDPTGPATLRCLGCGAVFEREPSLVCPRCTSDDVAGRPVSGWAYDDIEEARESPETASWAYHRREVYECQRCHHSWRWSGPAQPFLPPGD